jgi:ABC-type nickel/cobalt efflux system permease component RcnA
MVLEQLELTEQTPMMALAGAVLVIGTNKTLNWYNKRAARLEREAKAQRKDELRAKKADKEANKKPANKRKK